MMNSTPRFGARRMSSTPVAATAVVPVETSNQALPKVTFDDILKGNITISYVKVDTGNTGENLLKMTCYNQEQLLSVLEYLQTSRKSFNIHSVNGTHDVTVLGDLDLPDESETES